MCEAWRLARPGQASSLSVKFATDQKIPGSNPGKIGFSYPI